MRGEIVYFDTPAGGAVFSVGSITFCGSLWRDGRSRARSRACWKTWCAASPRTRREFA